MERGRVSESWDLVIVVGGDGTVLRQSAGVEGVLGYSPGALVGQNVLGYIHPADAVEGETAFHQAIEEPGASPPFELRWLHRDGTSRWLQTVANNRISEGEGVVCGSREVIAPIESQRALAENERRFRAIVESSLEIVKVVSTSGELLYANPAFRTFHGYDPEEAVASGMNVLDYVHPDDLPRVLEDTQKALAALAQATSERFPASVTEYRFRRADGSYCWIESIGAYLLDEPGVEGVIVHARDITARREAEQALRESEELRRAATNGAPIILFALNSEGEFTLSEGRGLEALGLEQNEVVGGSVFDLHRDGPRILENNRRALAGEEVTDTVEHGGLYFETRYSPLWDAEGRPQGTVCVGTDVTERVWAASETRMRDRALEASSNGVIITDPNQEDNPIIYVNPAFQRISGYQAGEVLGHNCRIFQAGDAEQPELFALAEAIAAGREHSCTIRNYRKDGTLFYNEIYVAPVRDASGDLKHFVGIQNDVTERRRLEEELSYRAFHDPLTGLPNRSLFVDRLENALSRAGRRYGPVCVAFMDLDDFKAVNDESGHEAGDELLVAVAARLRGCLRPEDTVCRMGGDEFVMLLKDAGEEEAAGVAHRVAEALRPPFEIRGARREVSVTTSLGLAIAPPGTAGESSSRTLFREADAAMYRAKRRGKAGYEISVLG